MNNPIMALAQMAMNRISSDPSFQKNPQARAFMVPHPQWECSPGTRRCCPGTANGEKPLPVFWGI